MGAVLVGVSLVLQLVAAAAALSLIRGSGRQLAWWLLAAACLLMALRRGMALYPMIASGAPAPVDVQEAIALAISALLVAGLVGVGRTYPALRREAERVRAADDSLFRLSKNLLCLADFDGYFLRLNPAWEETLGYPLEELRKRPFMDFVHPDDRARTAAEMSRLRRNEPVSGFQNRYLAADGSIRWLDWTSQPDMPNRLIYAVAMDVTSLKEAQAEAELLRTTIAQSSEMVLITDPTQPGNPIVFANHAAETNTGYRIDELIGRNPRILQGPGTAPSERDRLRTALRRGEPAAVELLNYRKDGQPYWSQVSLSPVFDRDKRLIYWIGLSRDVTAQRRLAEELRDHRDHLDRLVRRRTEELESAYEELREGHARLKEAQTIGRMGNWEFDLHTEAVFWSDQVYRMYERDPALGPPAYREVLAFYPGEHAERFKQAALRAGETGQPDELEVPVALPGGRRAIHLSTIRPVRDRRGRVVRLVGTVQDITDRKGAEEERRQFEEKMRQAQKLESLGLLAGGIAHDFNNLLMGIMGHASLLARALPPEAPGLRHVEAVQQAAARASELTSQMLAYSGRGRFVVELADLSELVREMAGLLRMSMAKDVQLKLELASGLPGVEADPTQLRQVVMNLITNAAEAIGGQPGTVTLRTALFDGLPPAATHGAIQPLPAGRYVAVEVRDDGCGMDAATLERIFDPFYTTKFAGRGLGLAAVQGIVRGHRGGIRVESAPGTGTAFCLYFRASDRELPYVETGAPEEEPAQGGHGAVLVVDDEPVVRAVAREILESGGYEVIEADNGRAALAIVEARPGELAGVLLDLTMPGLGGRATRRELAALRPALPVLLSSGYNEEEARDSDGGETAFIHKPYTAQQLLAAARAVFSPPPQGA